MSWFSAEHLHQLISTYGYGAVGAIVAMESIGLPAPGVKSSSSLARFTRAHTTISTSGA
jgi:hypothetical protein